MGSFATGFVLGSSQYPSQFTQGQGSQDRRETGNDKQDETLWHWVTHDAAGFFTLWLVIVGGGQLVLFWIQLRFIRESLDDAKIAADAARVSADTAKIQAGMAQDTLRTMQDTAERQLRAYVFPIACALNRIPSYRSEYWTNTSLCSPPY